jgi:hypothetical protein
VRVISATRHAVLAADVVKSADVRMLEPGNGAGFALESLFSIGICAGRIFSATVRSRRVSLAL